jgi:hypothetical protein
MKSHLSKNLHEGSPGKKDSDFVGCCSNYNSSFGMLVALNYGNDD